MTATCPPTSERRPDRNIQRAGDVARAEIGRRSNVDHGGSGGERALERRDVELREARSAPAPSVDRRD